MMIMSNHLLDDLQFLKFMRVLEIYLNSLFFPLVDSVLYYIVHLLDHLVFSCSVVVIS